MRFGKLQNTWREKRQYENFWNEQKGRVREGQKAIYARDSVTYECGRSQNKLRASCYKSRLCYCLRFCAKVRPNCSAIGSYEPTMVCLGPSTYIKVVQTGEFIPYMPTVIGYPQNRHRWVWAHQTFQPTRKPLFNDSCQSRVYIPIDICMYSFFQFKKKIYRWFILSFSSFFILLCYKQSTKIFNGENVTRSFFSFLRHTLSRCRPLFRDQKKRPKQCSSDILLLVLLKKSKNSHHWLHVFCGQKLLENGISSER